jgi:hypothetical protein
LDVERPSPSTAYFDKIGQHTASRHCGFTMTENLNLNTAFDVRTEAMIGARFSSSR